MSEINTSESSAALDDWSERFRAVQIAGGEIAKASDVEIEDIPQILREERHNARPEDLDHARQLVDNALARRQTR